jgi:hypothetical protein
MGPFYIASMHDYDIDFGIGILLKALLDFLNNKYDSVLKLLIGNDFFKKIKKNEKAL